MLVEASSIIDYSVQFMLPFIRLAAFLLVAPVFGTKTTPMKVRALLALSLSVMMSSMIEVPVFKGSFDIILYSLNEFLIGLAIGFTYKLIFGTLELAGQIAAQAVGLSFASSVDPQNGIQMPVIGQFFTIFGLLFFLAIDGHLLTIASLHMTFERFPYGQMIDVSTLEGIVSFSVVMFSMAFLIGLPVTMALMVSNITFAVITRAAPQMNIFAVGFPITILFGFWVLSNSFDNTFSILYMLFEKVHSYVLKI